MQKLIKLGLPIVCASLTPTVVFFLLTLLHGYQKNSAVVPIIWLTLPITIAHLIFLGVPCVWLLRKLKRFNWWSLTTAGFVLGCIPIGIMVSPVFHKSNEFYERGNVNDMGVFPSITWWMEWWMSWWREDYTLIAQAGAIGAITGLVFWASWSLCDSTRRLEKVKLRQK